jgi:hypothetical protein
MAGMALGPAIVLSGRDPSGRVWPWAAMTAVFLALFLHRLSLVYELAGDELIARSWWGLVPPERLALAGLESAEVVKGLALGAAGCGHVHLRSSLPGAPSLTILAQPRPERLALELEGLGQAARARSQGRGEAPEGAGGSGAEASAGEEG